MKPHKLVLAACALACLTFARCASIRATIAPASGGALGAIAGSALGPIGTVAGAGIGAASGCMLSENHDLRTGQLVGKEAVDNEAIRAGRTPGEAPPPWWLTSRAWIAAFALWFLIRMREHLFKKRPTAILRGIAHALFGGRIGRLA